VERRRPGARSEIMSKIHEQWTVLPHGPVVPVDDGILTVTGQIHMPLVELERRMTVVRLKDGGTVIYSAIALDEAGMAEIEALGNPRFLIVPGDAHRLDARIFKRRYPALTVIAPEGAAKHVAEAVAVDATHADFADPDVSLHPVLGLAGHEAALMVRRASGTTLILNDLIANLRRKGGFEGWLLHIMGFGGEKPEIPAVTRLMMIENKARLRQQLLAWADDAQLRRILVSHGDPIEANPDGILRDLAAHLA
jgi:hypothetical protein